MPMERHTVVTDRPCGALAERLVRTLPGEASPSFAISHVPLSYLLSLLLRLFVSKMSLVIVGIPE